MITCIIGMFKKKNKVKIDVNIHERLNQVHCIQYFTVLYTYCTFSIHIRVFEKIHTLLRTEYVR